MATTIRATPRFLAHGLRGKYENHLLSSSTIPVIIQIYTNGMKIEAFNWYKLESGMIISSIIKQQSSIKLCLLDKRWTK